MMDNLSKFRHFLVQLCYIQTREVLLLIERPVIIDILDQGSNKWSDTEDIRDLRNSKNVSAICQEIFFLFLNRNSLRNVIIEN